MAKVCGKSTPEFKLQAVKMITDQHLTREDAKASLFEYDEVFYNRVRRHSTLGYVSPVEYERTYNLNLR